MHDLPGVGGIRCHELDEVGAGSRTGSALVTAVPHGNVPAGGILALSECRDAASSCVKDVEPRVGRPHYQAELSLELDSGWVRRGHLTEMVVSEVTAGGQTLATTTTERTLTIRLVAGEQYSG